MTHIPHKEFETLNWLRLTERLYQCINSIVFKYVNNQCPNYLNKVSQTVPESNTTGSYLALLRMGLFGVAHGFGGRR